MWSLGGFPLTGPHTTGLGTVLPHPYCVVGTFEPNGPLVALCVNPEIFTTSIVTFPTGLPAVVQHPPGVKTTLVGTCPTLTLRVSVNTFIGVNNDFGACYFRVTESNMAASVVAGQASFLAAVVHALRVDDTLSVFSPPETLVFVVKFIAAFFLHVSVTFSTELAGLRAVLCHPPSVGHTVTSHLPIVTLQVWVIVLAGGRRQSRICA